MPDKIDQAPISSPIGSARAVAHRLTAGAAGAIAVIAVTGEGAADCVGQLWQGATQLSAGAVKRAALTFQGQEIDDALMVCRNRRHFEIHAHGGTAVVEQILDALRAVGVEVMQRERAELDFSVSADVPNRDSAPAILHEVLAALPGVDNAFALHLLAHQHEKGLAQWVQKSAKLLRAGLYADALWLVQAEAQWILQCEKFMRHFLHPPRIALIGRPNAGKSTLLNTLAGRTASITSDTAGTTRDWVDVTIRLASGGTSLNAVVVDTAGIRATADPLERESIVRSYQQRQHADVVVLVLDGTAEVPTPPPPDSPDAGPSSSAWIHVINKIDIAGRASAKAVTGAVRTVGISALHGDGMEDLHRAILASLGIADCHPDMPLVWTARQREILYAIAVAGNGQAAITLLDQLSGKQEPEDAGP
jgi:small GTP-binding protein